LRAWRLEVRENCRLTGQLGRRSYRRGCAPQGRAKKTRKFAEVKRLLNPKDARLCVLARTGGRAMLAALTQRAPADVAGCRRCLQEGQPAKGGREEGQGGGRAAHVRRPCPCVRGRVPARLICPGETFCTYWRARCTARRWRPPCSSTTTARWARRTTSCWTPTLSTFPFRTSWRSSRRRWTACTPRSFRASPTASWPSWRSSAPSTAWRSGTAAQRPPAKVPRFRLTRCPACLGRASALQDCQGPALRTAGLHPQGHVRR